MPLLAEPLIVALQLVVQDDTPDPYTIAVESLGRTQIGPIQLRVVTELARFHHTGIERLAGVVGAFATPGLEQVTATFGQRHERKPLPLHDIRTRDNQTRVTQPRQVSVPGILRALRRVSEIGRRHDSKGPHGG